MQSALLELTMEAINRDSDDESEQSDSDARWIVQ